MKAFVASVTRKLAEYGFEPMDIGGGDYIYVREYGWPEERGYLQVAHALDSGYIGPRSLNDDVDVQIFGGEEDGLPMLALTMPLKAFLKALDRGSRLYGPLPSFHSRKDVDRMVETSDVDL